MTMDDNEVCIYCRQRFAGYKRRCVECDAYLHGLLTNTDDRERAYCWYLVMLAHRRYPSTSNAPGGFIRAA